MINSAVITGRLTADPELKKTGSGTSYCRITVAVERSFAKEGEQRQADFLPVVCWRASAEFVCRHFSKGQGIGINGRIQTRRYETKDGAKRTDFAIIAEHVEFMGWKPPREEAKAPGEGLADALTEGFEQNWPPESDEEFENGNLPF